jgi:hypothetical protein
MPLTKFGDALRVAEAHGMEKAAEIAEGHDVMRCGHVSADQCYRGIAYRIRAAKEEKP